MKKAIKIGIGVGVVGVSSLSIFTILKQRKLTKQAFDAEFDDFDDEIVKNDEETNAPADDKPEFTKYTGIPVDTVTAMLNSVTHKYDDRYHPYFSDIISGNLYYINSDDFINIQKSLKVYRMYIRDNYSFCTDDENISGEMITFRIKEDYCVSNDGFFLIDGKWKYLSVNEVLDDYSRCARYDDRLFQTNRCFIK